MGIAEDILFHFVPKRWLGWRKSCARIVFFTPLQRALDLLSARPHFLQPVDVDIVNEVGRGMAFAKQRPTAKSSKISALKQLDPHGVRQEIEEDSLSKIPREVSKC